MFIHLWSCQPFTSLHLCIVRTHTRTHTFKLQWKSTSHRHTHSIATHIDSPFPFTWCLTYWAQTYGIYTLQIKKTHAHSLTHKQDQTQTRQMVRGQIQRGLLWDAEEVRKAAGKQGRGRTKEQRGEEEKGGERKRTGEEDDERSSSVYPRRSLKSMQPKENQSALLSYAVPFWRTSGAM